MHSAPNGVRAALVMPDLCHREAEYFDMMRRCRAELTRLAGESEVRFEDVAGVLPADRPVVLPP